ncbi:AAA family ATPase [Methylobacterium sp. SI9]|uniref:AAA family ATPase n=1 Tax=Methylobacterium guangdongense TaxID=3138811 RepID=UPI00313BD3AF
MTPVPPPASSELTPLTKFDGARPRRQRPAVGTIFHRVDRLPPRPPRSELIAGLAAAGEIIALAGAPGSGKSALATLMARTLADGTPFLGRSVRRGATVYVAAERAAEVERRLRSAASPGAALYVSSARPQLADPISVEELIEGVHVVAADEPLPIRLIVLDTAARCFSGLDENSSRDMGLAAEGMARILEEIPTAALLVLHHLDKSSAAMRGSTALLGAVDMELRVRGSGADRKATVTKANAVAEGQQFAFCMVVRKADDGLDVVEAEAADDAYGGAGRMRVVHRRPPDADTALAALSDLAGRGVVSLDDWRYATMLRFVDRTPASKRQAWSKVHRLLISAGDVVLDGNSVSISEASAGRQQGIGADGGKVSARSVSAPLPIGEGADVADAPRAQARKRIGRKRQR